MVAWDYGPFGQFLLNGLVVAVGGTLSNRFATCLMAGYGFARLLFPKPGPALFRNQRCDACHPPRGTDSAHVPLYEGSGAGSTATKRSSSRGPSAPSGCSSCGKFFRTIPRELEDAAKVDGASHFYIFLRVMVPMVRPAMGVLGLFTFISYRMFSLAPIIINSRAGRQYR